MSKNAVFCIATSQAQAERIASQLKAAGFPDESISLLLPDQDDSRDMRAGNVLISVHTEESGQVRLAEEILNREGAHDISSTGEISVRGIAPALADDPTIRAMSREEAKC